MPRKKLSQMSYEEREAHYKSLIKDFTIFDDIFMKVVFDDKDCVEYILQIILEKRDLRVVGRKVQAGHENLRGKSIIMDCLAIDDTGKKYDIEIQRDSRGASRRRARYHSSLLDANTLIAGENYDDLPECYVIFITAKDIIGDGKAIYHIKRVIDENGKSFNDGSHIIYVDSSKQDDTALGKLMHDLHCKEADKFYSKILGEKVRELKGTQKGVKTMCDKLQNLIDEGAEVWLSQGIMQGRAAGRLEGRAKGKMIMAQNMYNEGGDIDFIARMAGVPTSTVQEWVGAPTA